MSMSNANLIFQSQIEETIKAFPSLQRRVWGESEILKGIIPIIDVIGIKWEEYELEIHCSENFPFEFPSLFETSNKIPKIGDWHIYEDTLSCCVKVKPEELIRCKDGITIIDYIREQVIPYLFNQTHRRVEGYYVNGEYSHGLHGIYEFYSDTLGTGNNYKKTVELMMFIASHEKPGRTTFCFCGSNIKFRNCHRESFNIIKNIKKEYLELHTIQIAKALNFI